VGVKTEQCHSKGEPDFEQILRRIFQPTTVLNGENYIT